LRRRDEREPAAGLGDAPLGAHERTKRGRVDERALGEHDDLATGRERLVELRSERVHARQVEVSDDVRDANTFRGLRRETQLRLGHGANSSRRVQSARYGLVTDRILLSVPSGPRGTGVVSLVLGGLGSRLDLPVDRIDELTLAATTVAPAARDGALELEVDVLADRLVLRMGPLGDGAGDDVGVRRVVDALVDRVETIRRPGQEWLELELVRDPTG